MNHATLLFSLILILSCAACVSDVDVVEHEDAALSGQRSALLDDTPEAIGVLSWLNGPDATLETLDNEVGLYSNTARNIVSYIRGSDGALGTRDDNPIRTIAELDSIAKVGPSAISHILEYVESIGGVPREVVEGHSLTDAQIIRILEVINHYSVEALDFHVGIDKRAAYNLVARRPFGNMDEVAAVPYVGPATVGLLRDHADLRLPGDEDIVVEGVTFTPEQAAEVVLLANIATFDELDIEIGLDRRAAQYIIEGRQFETVADLATVRYVGRSALKKMRDFLPQWEEEQQLLVKR